ncbi:MAG: radical SAM protein [Candidatus Aenigmarchaeota archaeon]|nr:radical SAM protein [Candidatus Aenigmarchaeota archaeon]
MRVNEIKVKSILGKSSIGDYCINPYVGCMISCIYCYADYYTRKFSKHQEEWGSYVDVKINAPEVLLKEIGKKKKGIVYISPLTDAYQPLEAKYKITRKILEILARYDWPVVIQTKSPLVLRDLDILKKFSNIEIGFTITSLDGRKTRRLEKFASSPKERVKALKILKEAGIKTFVFIGPIIPFTSIEEIERIVEETKEFSDEFYFDKLNLKPGLIEKIRKVEDFEEMEEKKMNEYYSEIKREILSLIEKEKIKARILF